MLQQKRHAGLVSGADGGVERRVAAVVRGAHVRPHGQQQRRQLGLVAAHSPVQRRSPSAVPIVQIGTVLHQHLTRLQKPVRPVVSVLGLARLPAGVGGGGGVGVGGGGGGGMGIGRMGGAGAHDQSRRVLLRVDRGGHQLLRPCRPYALEERS